MRNLIERGLTVKKKYTSKISGKDYLVLIRKGEIRVLTPDRGEVAFGIDKNVFISRVGTLTKTDILKVVEEEPQDFNLEKSKLHTCLHIEQYKEEHVGGEFLRDLIDRILDSINRIQTKSGMEFVTRCQEYLYFYPELFKRYEQMIRVCYDYSDVAKDIAHVVVDLVAKDITKEQQTPKPPIIADFFIKDGKNNTYGGCVNDETRKLLDGLRMLYRVLYDTGILKKISFQYKDYSDIVYFAFDTKDLMEYYKTLSVMIPNLNALLAYIISHGTCVVCGATQPSSSMMTYRTVDGMTSKRRECWYASELNNEAVAMIRDEKDTNGVEAAVNLAFDMAGFK